MNPDGSRARDGIRDADPEHASAIRSIYAPLVRDTHVSFETEPPSEMEVRRRMEVAPVPWLVWESDGKVAGFASAGRFRERAAYRWTAEASVYVAPAARRRGIGRGLCEAMMDRLRDAGFRSAVGVVALPNPASEQMLETLGFRCAGVLHEAGFKLERWWDVSLWQRSLTH